MEYHYLRQLRFLQLSPICGSLNEFCNQFGSCPRISFPVTLLWLVPVSLLQNANIWIRHGWLAGPYRMRLLWPTQLGQFTLGSFRTAYLISIGSIELMYISCIRTVSAFIITWNLNTLNSSYFFRLPHGRAADLHSWSRVWSWWRQLGLGHSPDQLKVENLVCETREKYHITQVLRFH